MISYIDNVKNVVTEVPITIAASSWSSSAPYTYTWTDSRVLAGSSVDVDILATTVDTSVISLDYEKTVGSVTFTADVKPTANIAVTIRIINARADLGTSISADTVATDAISGASNVDQALGKLNSNMNTYKASTDYIVSNIAGVKSKLLELTGALVNGESKVVRIVHTDNNDSKIMRPSARYEGLLCNNYLGSISWLATNMYGDIVSFSYETSSQAWTIKNIIVRSDWVTIPAGGSASFSLPGDGVYMLAGCGSAIQLQNVVFLIGGYATASRCSVINLTGNSVVTIDASNTSSLIFTASNAQSNNSVTLQLIKIA